jgi:O-acetyl-ADP-ribose deacetylase (regulator of RNase III)
MKIMEIYLVSTNPELVLAWEKEFADLSVVIIEDDILSVAENTIVSPANSYGFMDGGIDRLYTEFFGLRPQTEVQDYIANHPEGCLPIGSAILVETGHSKIPYMIAAPTMETPGPVRSINSFFAMSAALNIAYRNRKVVTKVYCPGLATGIGRVPPDEAAVEMANAYKKWKIKFYGSRDSL